MSSSVERRSREKKVARTLEEQGTLCPSCRERVAAVLDSHREDVRRWLKEEQRRYYSYLGSVKVLRSYRKLEAARSSFLPRLETLRELTGSPIQAEGE